MLTGMETPTPSLSLHFINPLELMPYEKNAKVHSEEQILKIAHQISEFGFDQPIVVDKEKVVVKGHGRRLAAIKLGLKEVPVIIATHLTEEQAIAARIADNKVGEAPWDPELLKFDLLTLQRLDFNMELTGFELPKIEEMLNPLTSEDKFTEKSHQSVSERKEGYENSDIRQIILVTDPETFEKTMRTFAELQGEFQVETNVEVVEKLMEFYAENRSPETGPDGAVQEEPEGDGLDEFDQ